MRFYSAAFLSLLAIVGSCVSRAAAETTSICIEYFGEQASALLPVVIGDSKAAADLGSTETLNDTHLFFPNVFVVDPKVIAGLVREAETVSTHEIELKNPYVVFHLVVLKDGHREVKILDGDQTFGLLDRFKELCGQGSLSDHLKYVQRVIELYEGTRHM